MKFNKTKIWILMAERGYGNVDLERLTGIKRQNISTILNRGTCSPVTLGRIAKGLSVPVDTIIEQEEAHG